MGLLRRSLTARLLTYFLLLVIVTATSIGYIVYNSGRQVIIDRVEAHNYSVATMRQQAIEHWVDHIQHLLILMKTDKQIIGDSTALTTHTIDEPEYQAAHDSMITEFSRITVLGHITQIFLLNSTSGMIIASSDANWEGQFRETQQYFIQGKADTYVSDLFYSLTLGRPTMVISTPVRDSDGKLSGVLAAHVNLEPLTELTQERSGLGETAETYLVGENNLLLTNLYFEPGTAFKKWIFTEGVNRALNGESGVGLYLNYREVPVIGSYRWIEEMKIALVVEVDEEEALAPVNHLRNTIGMVAGIIFIIAAGLGWLLAQRINKPLAQLADYSRKVEKGDYSAEIEIKGEDEIASVTSDVKTMVGQLLTAQENLLRSERLATLGQFSGSISHELRNPLGTIAASVYYLGRRLKDADEKVKENLDRIQASVDGATAIIQSILNLTRMKEPQHEKVGLLHAISNTISTSKIPATINVVQNLPEEEIIIDGDSEQLRMAFKNILINSIDAMDGQGTLTITAHTTAEGLAELSIADTGPGVPDEDTEKIFQPLFSTKAKGIGFGLSITRMIIDRHGGNITAKSGQGKGATFIIHIPLHSEKPRRN